MNALGQFSLDVPIAYGENPVDFIAYGPFGEVRQFNRTYRVSPDVIRARRFEYALSAGACRRDAPCEATANADLRYGISRRTTVFAGLDQFWRDTLPNLFHPYGGIVAGLTNAFVAEAEFVGDAILRGQLRFEPSSDLLLIAEATKFSRDVIEPILTLPGRNTQFTFFGQARPVPGPLRNWIVVDASLDLVDTETERFSTARIGGSIQPGQVRFIPSIRWEHRAPKEGVGGEEANTTTFGLNAIVLPIRSLGSLFGFMTARGGIEFMTSFEPRSASAFVSRPLGRYVRLEVGGTWFTGTKATLSAFLAADLPTVRAYTTVERTSAGSLNASAVCAGFTALRRRQPLGRVQRGTFGPARRRFRHGVPRPERQWPPRHG